MDWSAVGQAAAGTVTVAAAAWRWLGGGVSSDSRRRGIHRNLELYAQLPEDFGSRDALARDIDRQVGLLISELQVEKRVDPIGIWLGLAFVAGAGAIVYRILAVDWTGWWWWVVASLALVGVVGLSQDAIPRERDERGRVIKNPKE
ncbi:MAG TPA: hypothetical protein VK611_29545 [Acidimicrobiales bacterium]|nr:hypothetical protein [Acidimicrobiales bacterium]